MPFEENDFLYTDFCAVIFLQTSSMQSQFYFKLKPEYIQVEKNHSNEKQLKNRMLHGKFALQQKYNSMQIAKCKILINL